MADEKERLSPLEMLQLYPEMVVEDLVEDDAFRQRLGLRNGMLLIFGKSGRFGQRDFYDAIRVLYSGAEQVGVVDVAGKKWKLGAVEGEGQPALKLTAGKRSEFLFPHHVLHPDHTLRLAELDRVNAHAGLWPGALPEWRELLAERSLRDEEVQRFQEAFEQSPSALSRRIDVEFETGTGTVRSVAPDRRGYYGILAGTGIATNLEDLGRDVVRPHVDRLLHIADGSGGPLSLLLGAHSSLLRGSSLEQLSNKDAEALFDWAVKAGDLLSRTAAIELGLAILSRVPSIEASLVSLIESMRDQDPNDPAGRLQLFSGLLALVGSEFSRTRVIEDFPPFQKRLVQFAQAALFERLAFGRIDTARMAIWARQHGVRRFYFQTMIDRRLEPRWTAELAVPAQLKAEFASRITLAADKYRAHVPDGQLYDLLFGDGEESIRKQVVFPQSFSPGPLEGAIIDGQTTPLPPKFEELVNKALASDMLEPKSIIALINLRSVFAIDQAKVDRAIELIRSAGHRFELSVDPETRLLLFNGLASLAAEVRSTDLADELRMMVRKDRRSEQSRTTLRDEFPIAINAACAFSDRQAWAEYIGNWCTELAFIANGDDADGLRDDLELLSAVEPSLRSVIGAANVALASVTARRRL